MCIINDSRVNTLFIPFSVNRNMTKFLLVVFHKEEKKKHSFNDLADLQCQSETIRQEVGSLKNIKRTLLVSTTGTANKANTVPKGHTVQKVTRLKRLKGLGT